MHAASSSDPAAAAKQAHPPHLPVKMPKPRMMKAEKVAAIMDVFQGNHKDGSMMVRNSKAPASPAARPPAGIGCRQRRGTCPDDRHDACGARGGYGQFNEKVSSATAPVSNPARPAGLRATSHR